MSFVDLVANPVDSAGACWLPKRGDEDGKWRLGGYLLLLVISSLLSSACSSISIACHKVLELQPRSVEQSVRYRYYVCSWLGRVWLQPPLLVRWDRPGKSTLPPLPLSSD